MPMIDFEPPERFVADTVGPPGQRVFFLQATQGSHIVTVSLEKEQVRLLGESIGEMLDNVAPEVGSELAGEAVADNAPLDTPIEEDFRVQRLSLAWDEEHKSVIVEAHDGEDDETDEEGASSTSMMQSLRVHLSPAFARAFSQRCARAVEGGRPNCPFCGNPLDPSGHICPRANGYRR